MTHLVATEFESAGLTAEDLALCRFAKFLTSSPTEMKETQVVELRQQGFCDAAIHDAAQIASYFNYINRIADSLNVDLEEDIHAWEQGVPEKQ